MTAALQSDSFLGSLYSTLEAWGIGTRASKLIPFDDFASELRRWSQRSKTLTACSLILQTWDSILE